jgi:Na+-translocating ferredoxin:NAD+ oxidoreductase RNF subunit RnfB
VNASTTAPDNFSRISLPTETNSMNKYYTTDFENSTIFLLLMRTTKKITSVECFQFKHLFSVTAHISRIPNFILIQLKDNRPGIFCALCTGVAACIAALPVPCCRYNNHSKRPTKNVKKQDL